MGICGIEAAWVRKAPELTIVSTKVSVVPHSGHAGSAGRAWTDDSLDIGAA
jgi:hypothetical protein